MQVENENLKLSTNNRKDLHQLYSQRRRQIWPNFVTKHRVFFVCVFVSLFFWTGVTVLTISYSADCKNQYDDIDIGEDISCFEEWEGVGKTSKENKSGFMSLSPFGMASYKLQEPFWFGSSSSSDSGNARMSEMYSAADSWLKQLNAHHHDFNFFTLRAPL
jgi:hypothetical protein